LQKGIRISDSEPVIMKYFRRELNLGLTEASLLTILQQYPFVVRLLECFQPDDSFGLEKFVIIMERLQPLPHPSTLSLKSVVSVAKQLLTALTILHERAKIAHMDIKPNNLMLTPAPRGGKEKKNGLEGRLRLIDFGLSAPIVSNVSLPACGTLQYMAPEVEGDLFFSCLSD
jgi:serine/threonine protein kinase